VIEPGLVSLRILEDDLHIPKPRNAVMVEKDFMVICRQAIDGEAGGEAF
jgi:hypothetical protein